MRHLRSVLNRKWSYSVGPINIAGLFFSCSLLLFSTANLADAAVDSDGDGWSDALDYLPNDVNFSQPDNLELNPGAEDDDQNWSASGTSNGVALIKGDVFHSGAKSFYLQGSSGSSEVRWVGVTHVLPAGVRTYYWEGWIKTENAENTRLQVVLSWADNSKSFKNLYADSGSNDWAFFSNTATETEDIAAIQFRMVTSGAVGSTAWFDDLALFVVVPNDNDLDGIDDSIDPDDDGDGIEDGSDAFPLDSGESLDTDEDGIGNNTDTDDDGDGVLDVNDAYPLDPTRTVNTAPTISTISDQVISEDSALGLIAFVIADAEDAAGTLSVTALSSDQSVVVNADISLSGTDGSRGISLTPLANASGTVTITITVSDGGYSTDEAFEVTVSAVNDPPTISLISDQEGVRNALLGPLAFSVDDDATPVNSLLLTAVSSNQTLVPNSNISLGGSDGNHILTITPGANELGTAAITLTVSDGSLSADQVFSVDIVADIFSPAKLNPVLWLDAMDDASVIHAGNAISQWLDKSGNDFHATQAELVLQPTYDAINGVILFNQQLLDTPHIDYGVDNKISLYVITKPDEISCNPDCSNQWILATSQFSGSQAYSLARRSNSNGGKYEANVAGDSVTGLEYDGGIHLTAQLIDGSTNKLWVDGVLIGSVEISDIDKALANTELLRIGSAVGSGELVKPYSGELGEILIFQSELSDFDRSRVEGYMAEKWGFRDNLPAEHPFKSQNFGVLAEQSFTVNEDASNGDLVGTLQAVGLGEHDFSIWELVEVVTIYQGIFSVTSNGEIRVTDNAQLDYEKTGRHLINVRVYDDNIDEWSSVTEVEINVADVLDGQTKDYSLLWGVDGELWDPLGRLPDYSYAGYHGENAELPDIPIRKVVTDAPYNADDSGSSDAADAVQAAIDDVAAAIANGDYLTAAVHLPAGTYRFEHPIIVRSSGIVIRGDVDGLGNPTTIIFSPFSPQDALAVLSAEEFLASWDAEDGDNFLTGEAGHMVRFSGGDLGNTITSVTVNALRGDRTLTVANASSVIPGEAITLDMVDTVQFGPLWQHLHNDQITSWDNNSCSWGSGTGRWTFWVESVEGNTITLREPIPFDIRTEWQPIVRYFTGLQEVGVENLRFEFFDIGVIPVHLTEPGYNGVGFSRVVNAWAKNLEFLHSDNGLTISSESAWITTKNLKMFGRAGHHGISVNGSTQILIDGVYFESEDRLPQVDPDDQNSWGDGVDDGWIHAVTFTHKSARSVMMNLSSGSDYPVLHLDYHRNGPMENLITEVNSPWDYASGGNGCAGPHAAARNTFWNLLGEAGEVGSWGSGNEVHFWGGIQANVVNALSVGEQLTEDARWYEKVDNLQPANIYTAQLEKRLGPVDDGDGDGIADSVNDSVIEVNNNLAGTEINLILSTEQLIDVDLQPGVIVTGGTLGGLITGDDNQPIIHSAILPNSKLVNVIIGDQAVFDSSIIVGAGTRFESSGLIPAQLDLSNSFAVFSERLPGVSQPQILDLNHSIVVGERTLLDGLRAVDPIFTAGVGLTQNSKGVLKLDIPGESIALSPVAVSQAEAGFQAGIAFSDDAEVVITTDAGQQVISNPAVNDLLSLEQASHALGLQIDINSQGNLFVRSEDASDTSFVARPSVNSFKVAENTDKGLYTIDHFLLPNLQLAVLVFEQNGEKRQQAFYPSPFDWDALQLGLTTIEGAEQVQLDISGVILLTIDGVIHRGVMDYAIQQGNSQLDSLNIEATSDLNADGFSDFMVIYASGDRQVLYYIAPN